MPKAGRISKRLTVSLKNIDTTDAEYSPRACEIKVGGISISTPSRALSSQEANAYFATSVTIDPATHEMYEHVKTYSREEIAAITRKNGKLRDEVVKIQRMKGKHSDKVSLFYPIRMADNIVLDSQSVEGLIDLQFFAGFDLITIPDYWPQNTSVPAALKAIAKLREMVEGQYEKALVPYVRLNRKLATFEPFVRGLLEMGFPLVGIEYASALESYPQLRLIRNLSRESEETSFHVSKVPGRKLGPNQFASAFHFLSLFGIDTVSLGVRAVGGGKQPIENVSRFSPRGLGVLSFNDFQTEESPSQSDCTCPVCKDMSVEEYYENYRKRPGGKVDDPTYFRAVGKVHEAFSSLDELRVSQKFIRDNDFIKDYVPTKKYLYRSVSTKPLTNY
jgi:hypothetical protein